MTVYEIFSMEHTLAAPLLEKCEKTGILVECGFLSNQEEAEKLSLPEYQKAVAAVIGAAVSGKLA